MFAPNDDQQLLTDSARRFTQKHYADDKLGQMGEASLNTALWTEMAEAGWLMLPFAGCWAKAWWSNRCWRARSSPAA